MSRSRRQQPGSNSLELLLDTICNTFGGILFIALLVTILTQLSEKKTPVPRPSTATPEEIESLVLEQAHLLAEISRVRANQDAEDLLASRLAPAEIQQLLTERNRLRDELHSVSDQIQSSLAENARVAADIQKILHQLSQVQAEIPEEKRKLAALEDAIDRKVEKRSQQLRLSQVRSSFGKSEVAIVLRYGRAYLWHQYDARGNRLGLNTDDFIVLESDAKSVTVRPNPLRGIPLDGSPQSRQALSRLLEPFAPNRNTIVVVARPDTYHAFPQVRDATVASGFEYRLFVSTEDGPVVDRGGRGGPVQ